MRLYGWTKALIITLLTVALALTLGNTNVTNANPAAQAFSATVQPLGGVVEYQSNGGAWQNITKVTLLHAGDSIRTGATGVAEVSTVTGIKVEVYPTTQIQLQALSMNSGNNAGQNFALNQLVGTMYVAIDQKLKPEDNVQFFTPSGTITIRGTHFYLFVGPTGHTAVIGEENVVSVLDFLQQRFDNADNEITTVDLGDLSGNAVCSVDFLKASGKGHHIASIDNADDRKVILDFMKDFLKGNVDDGKRQLIAGLLGMPDTTTQEDLLTALDKFDKPLDLKTVMDQIRTFLSSDLGGLSGKPLTKTDTADKASCGNGFCETQGKGESLLTCSADCFPNGQAIQACINIVNNPFVPPPGNGGNGGGVSTPPATQPASTPPPPTIKTPKPSGVGA